AFGAASRQRYLRAPAPEPAPGVQAPARAQGRGARRGRGARAAAGVRAAARATARVARVARALPRHLGSKLPAPRRPARGAQDRRASKQTFTQEAETMTIDERKTTMRFPKAVVTLPTDSQVLVERSFKAPRALVYRAHTEPPLMRRWLLGYAGWTMPVCEMDVREGGKYRWRWKHDEDGKEFGFHGVFQEVVANQRLRHTQVFDPGEFG